MATPDKTLDVLIRLRTETDKAIKDIHGSNKAIKELGESGSKATTGVNKLFGSMRSLVATATGLFGVHQAIRFVTQSLREFADGERQTANLNTSIKLMGGNAEKLKPIIKSLGDEARKYGYTQTDVDKSVGFFLLTLGDMDQAIQATRAAFQVASATGDTFSESMGKIGSVLVGRMPVAVDNFTAEVKKYEQELRDATTINERFNVVMKAMGNLSVSASGQLGNFGTSGQRFLSTWSELQEAFGGLIVNKTSLQRDMEFLRDVMRRATDDIEGEKQTALQTLKDSQLENTKTQTAILKVIDSAQGKLDGFGKKIKITAEEFRRLTELTGLAQFAISQAAQGKRPEVLDRLERELAVQVIKERETREQIEKETVAAEKKLQEALEEIRKAARDRQLKEFLVYREEYQKRLAIEEATIEIGRLAEETDRNLKANEEELQLLLNQRRGNLEEQLKLVREYGDKEVKIRSDAATKIVKAETILVDDAKEKLAKLTDLPVSDIERIAQRGGLFGEILDLEKERGLVIARDADSLEKARQEYEKLKAALAGIARVNDGLLKAGLDVELRIAQKGDDLTKDLQKQIGEKLQNEVVQIEARVNIGALSPQRGTADILAARQAAVAEYSALETSRLKELAALGDSDNTAARRKQLIADIREIQAEIAKLQPTFEEQARASDNFWEGLSIGARQASADAQTFGQLGSDVTKTFEEGIASGGAQLFDNLVTGAKNFGETMRQVFSDLLRQIAQLIIQTLIFRAISSALGSIGGATSTASSQVATQTGGGLSRNIVLSGGIRMAEGGVIDVGTGPTADDVPILASKGEGIVNAKAVSAYGAPVIHALNRLAIPRNVFAGLTMPSMPQVPQLRFAQGGVVGDAVRSQASGDRSQAPLVLNNVVAIGDSEAKRLFASSAFKDAVRSEITQNAGHIERTVRGKRGFRDD